MTCTADSGLLDYGHPPSDHLSCTTGYGTNQDGKTMCYSCCHIADLADIAASKPGDRFSGYISGDGKTWTNWPGGTLGHVIQRSSRPHPWSRERYYYRVRDQHRRVWSGTGAPGMWATLRLTKGTA
jgi:hypothetical protein